MLQIPEIMMVDSDAEHNHQSSEHEDEEDDIMDDMLHFSPRKYLQRRCSAPSALLSAQVELFSSTLVEHLLSSTPRRRSINFNAELPDSCYGFGEQNDDTSSIASHPMYPVCSEWVEDFSSILGIEYYDPILDYSHEDTSFDFSMEMSNEFHSQGQEQCCEQGKMRPVTHYCETCGTALCLLCKLKHDAGHPVTEQHTSKNMLWLQKCKQRCKAKVSTKKEKLNDLKQYQNNINRQRKQVEEMLKTRRENIHQKIDKEYKNIMLQVESVWNREITVANRLIAKVTMDMEENKQMLQEIEKMLSRYPCTLPDLPKNKDEKTKNQNRFNQCYFILSQGADTTNQLGSFSTRRLVNADQQTCLISAGKVLRGFDTRTQQQCSYMATGLSITTSGDILVTDFGQDMVRLYDPEGDLKVILNILPRDEPTNALRLNNGTFLAACKDGLKLFSQQGEFVRRVEQSVESPQGLAKTKTGHIFVTDRQATGSMVHILSCTDLECLHTIIGGTRAPMFTQAWYATVDHESSIIISDCCEHSVKVITPQGLLVHEFGGKGCQPGQFFSPAGMCVDSYGHIIVADTCNNRVQMFSNTGEFLAVIVSSDDGIKAPTDLDIDKNGHLVVLQSRGQVKVIQYTY